MSFCKSLRGSLSSVVLITLILVSYSPEAQSALTPEQLALLEDILVNRTLINQHVTGLSISIVQGDGFNDVFSRGYGLRNVAKGLPATNETLYGVGSLSKMIASFYITKILNDKFPDLGESVLDVPVRTLAPDFNFTLGDRYRTEYMTFRDLLAHKVCLNTATDMAGLMGAFANKQDAVYRQRYCPQNCGFRQLGWHYNNAMVHMAAEMAAHIHGTGEAFEDLLEKFLPEAGMVDTRVVRAEDDYDEIPNMSQGYYRRNDENHVLNLTLIKRSAVIPAAGGILTTSNDMANFMAILGTYGKRMDGVQVVGEHIIQWMARNSNPYMNPAYKSNEGDRPRGDSGYGIGLILGANDGFERLRHTGYITPFTATMNVYPKLKLGVFTAANGPSIGVNHNAIHDELFEIIRGIIGGPNRGLTREFEPSTSVDNLSPDPAGLFTNLIDQMSQKQPELNFPMAKYSTARVNHSTLVGTYGSATGGNFEILDIDEITLYIKYGEWGRGQLIQRHDTPTVYDAIIVTDLAQSFFADGAEMPAISADFSTPMTVILNVGGLLLPYAQNFSLENLPSQPYADDSCGFELNPSP